MFIKILKFGGSSVGTSKMIKKAGEIVKIASKKEKVAVVVSAFQGVTDQLLKCAKLAVKNGSNLDEVKKLKNRHTKAVNQLAKSQKLKAECQEYIENLFQELSAVSDEIQKEKFISDKNLDLVASFGERLSAYIIAASVKNAYFVDARDLVKTDDNFTNAAVDFNKTNRRVQNFFRNKKGIPVITGFLGSTSKGETTTLGRGGSDYTASIFGAALGVKVVEIWTDVDGVMSADPKLVKNAQVLPKISYEEAIEMAYFGAKVIHPATMLPAIKKGIPILIKNTFNPKAHGTLISKEFVLQPLVKCVTSVDNVALINIGGVSLAGIPGSAARVFEATARAKANVILISQASSENTICFAIKSGELKSALSALKKEFQKEIKSGQVNLGIILNQSILAMVGDGMCGVPGIAGMLFSVLGGEGVNVSAIAQGGSERNISFVVDSASKIKALNVAHDEFFYCGRKNIFLVGTGNIGGALLDQIKDLQKNGSALRICGIIDAFHMLQNERGNNLLNWRKTFEKGEKPNLEKWLSWAKVLPVGNKVFVDCTASDGVAKKYIEMAEAGFHIVTPNKKFNVFPMKEYKKLREVMAKNKKRFLYETNVGAALPVISTLQDLLKTGDKITKIEGIFSGTLSYIFNNFGSPVRGREGTQRASASTGMAATKSFSEVVGMAKKLGYTEPDPREDLNGNDVGRKLLVLARETGLEMEMIDVKIENLVPKSLQKLKTSDEFLKVLPKYDDYFKKRLENAKKKNKVLRYVAKLSPVRGREGSQRASASNGIGWRASASLQAISLDNPLSATKDADNIFAFYTKRYNKRPLVVQGPGAGREVTAGGVLADILRI
ncbi:MAG: bifunctional aspartate kinase/homoserine dehydrogenase I [bacterium]|nr:bifunctional aspartate kinase/homoserine dehydrogenase I [bacterium]